MSRLNWDNRVDMLCFTLLDKFSKNEERREQLMTNTYFVFGILSLPGNYVTSSKSCNLGLVLKILMGKQHRCNKMDWSLRDTSWEKNMIGDIRICPPPPQSLWICSLFPCQRFWKKLPDTTSIFDDFH